MWKTRPWSQAEEFGTDLLGSCLFGTLSKPAEKVFEHSLNTISGV